MWRKYIKQAASFDKQTLKFYQASRNFSYFYLWEEILLFFTFQKIVKVNTVVCVLSEIVKLQHKALKPKNFRSTAKICSKSAITTLEKHQWSLRCSLLTYVYRKGIIQMTPYSNVYNALRTSTALNNSSHSEVFCKKGVLNNFAKFTGF